MSAPGRAAALAGAAAVLLALAGGVAPPRSVARAGPAPRATPAPVPPRPATPGPAPSPSPAGPSLGAGVPAHVSLARPVEALESAPVARIGAVDYVAVNDLARLLAATRYWRADVRKLVLRVGDHRFTLTVDDPFAIVDERTVWLRAPVLSRRGELQAPVALLDSLPRDSTIARLIFEPRRALVVKAPQGGVVGSPELSVGDSLTRVTFPVERLREVAVAGRARLHFRVRLDGTFVGSLPETLPASGLVRRITPVRAASGCAFEFELAPAALGWRLARLPGPAGGERVVLDVLRLRARGMEAFAEEERPAHGVRVIVLDPGHGGEDVGVVVASDLEKNLTLTLARLLSAELARRLPARVVLTRDDDRSLTDEQRAETANRAHADLVLSLHFDAVPGTARAGATAWCPPAAVAAGGAPAGPRAPVVLLPWREVAERHAVLARSAAESILGALDLAGAGPVRLRERLMRPLLGVDAPGVMLDCATLSAASDRARVEDPAGLQALAAAIADGVARWARGG